jgi:hypothetical protein
MDKRVESVHRGVSDHPAVSPVVIPSQWNPVCRPFKEHLGMGRRGCNTEVKGGMELFFQEAFPPGKFAGPGPRPCCPETGDAVGRGSGKVGIDGVSQRAQIERQRVEGGGE